MQLVKFIKTESLRQRFVLINKHVWLELGEGIHVLSVSLGAQSN